MRTRFLWYLTLFSLVSALIVGCSQTLFGARIGQSPQVIYEQTHTYYPLNLSKTIMRTDSPEPNTPDYQLQLEGIGWQDERLFAVLTITYRDRDVYLDKLPVKKMTLTYKNQSFPLTKLLWEEGHNGRYKDSSYRFALGVNDTDPTAPALPVGTWPEQVQIGETLFPLPKQAPAATTLPAQHQLKANLKEKDLPNQIESSYLTYQVTGFVANEQEQRLKLLVTSDMSSEESSSFLLKDDKGRIYRFNPETLPKAYPLGDTEYDLTLLDSLPADLKHLRLIIFEVDKQASHTYSILDEANIRLF
ncbi:hypothetical protein [Brevibacillus dissolubilis]|uniref:hypothetical protein n=1 Tax=Brevibacillus dissolubilis TaxID=1844116 RepID=UPI0011174E66|nr:hypothetical protein [Brevibacillus dissolubilis]